MLQWLTRLIVLLFFLLPALAVNNSSADLRIIWIFSFLLLYFVIINTFEGVPYLHDKESKNEKKRRLFSEKYLKYVWLCFGVPFVAAEIISIAATYGDAGIVGPVGRAIISVGERLFPVVAGYATSMEPPLSAAEVFRAQTTISSFFIAVSVSSVAYVVYVIAGPEDDSIAWQYMEPMSFLQIIWMSAIFIMMFSLSALFIFGWMEFLPGGSCKGKGSIISAYCYMKDGDLGIYVALPIKLLVLFVAPMMTVNCLKGFMGGRRIRNRRLARSRRRTGK